MEAMEQNAFAVREESLLKAFFWIFGWSGVSHREKIQWFFKYQSTSLKLWIKILIEEVKSVAAEYKDFEIWDEPVQLAAFWEFYIIQTLMQGTKEKPFQSDTLL